MAMNERPSMTELTAFTTIARLGSFRAAADELGFSASTLSHMMRDLEERLGVRLLNRTTRSVAPTEAGSRLLERITPVLSELDSALAEVDVMRETPHGTLRLNIPSSAGRPLMERIVPEFLKRYPHVQLDLVVNDSFIDIVAEGFDAGVRYRDAVATDMVAVPFGGREQHYVIAAAPSYVERYGVPTSPSELRKHECIRKRMPTGKFYRWEVEHHGVAERVDVKGQLSLDSAPLEQMAMLAGVGLGYIAMRDAAPLIAEGKLVQVMADWTPPFDGLCLYFPAHRLLPTALRAFVDVVRELEAGRS